MESDQFMAARKSSRMTLTGVITSSFTNTFMVTMVQGLEPAIRPAGPGSSLNLSSFMECSMQSRYLKLGNNLHLLIRQTMTKNKMKQPKYPLLYQINTRVWVTELSRKLGRRATLDDITDDALDKIAEDGFDWVWFLSVWRTGELGRKVSRENLGWRHEFENTLPDLDDKDIEGSGFAIMDYTVHPDLGGDSSLSKLRSRLQQRGLKLMLDFVPNHMGP